uniref:hypothetical protein n=1 Tax=Marinobacterium profundum TaxID=1714300 RepID=UPI000AD0E8C9|nr:hypothetical protein [Marinobacterium profundum]
MLKSSRLCMLLVVGLLMGAPTQLWAHSFDIAVIAPFSGPEAAVGSSLWQGMRVATRETDGHPQETSDGHLGGVDSNLRRIDSQAGTVQVAQQLRALGESQGFLIAVLSPDQASMLETLPEGIAAVVMLTADQDDQVPNHFTPPTLPAASRLAFSDAYRQFYGSEPDEMAQRGYAIARLIDIAVRPTDGHFSDKALLQQQFADALLLQRQQK